MMYPVTTNIYIQTDQIETMTLSTLTILMSNGTSFVVTAAQFADVIRCVNENHG
jgi:ABC-type sugar transport system ATPase subunit